MRPKERLDSGQNDLFRARLDQIVNGATFRLNLLGCSLELFEGMRAD